jgi:hypothetical protein
MQSHYAEIKESGRVLPIAKKGGIACYQTHAAR